MGNCEVCFGDLEDSVIINKKNFQVVTVCLHILCRICAIRSIEINNCCPFCRRFLEKEDILTVPRSSRFTVDLKSSYQPSAKILAVMKEIKLIVEKNEKCVLFTQFLGMMDIFEHVFE